MNCTSYQEQIALWVGGDLALEAIPQLELHINACVACRQFAVEMRESYAGLSRLQEPAENEFVYQRIRQNILSEISQPAKHVRLTWTLRVAFVVAVMSAFALGSVMLYSRLFVTPVPTVEEKKEQREKQESRVTEVPTPQTPQDAQVVPQDRQMVALKQEAGAIYGLVSAENGERLPGVNVALTSTDGGIRTTHTNATGEFRFQALNAGTYSIEFSIEAFSNVRRDGIVVRTGDQTRLLARLQTRTTEEFDIVADTPFHDTKKTGQESGFNREYADKVPSGRDPWVVIEQSPEIENDRTNKAGSESGQQTGYYARGPSDDENAWNHDGIVRAEVSPPEPGAELVRPSPPPAAELPAPSPPPSSYALPEPAIEGSGNSNVGLGFDPGKTTNHLYIIEQEKLAEKRKLSEGSGRTPTYYDFDSYEEVTATSGALKARKADGQMLGEFPLKHTEVSTEISATIAKTIVEQQYTNPYKEAIEAVYVFPLPAMAAVNDFVMEIGDHRIVGIVRPREEAERIYQEAKERGQTASLLTQERPNLFTQNVANIEPGGKVQIKITYFETLEYEKGYYEYVFPMVVGPRYIPGNTQPLRQSRQPGGGTSAPTDQVPDADRITPPVLKPGQRSGHDIGVTIHLDAGLPIRDLQCDTHRMSIQKRGDSQRILELEQSDSIPNRDLVLRWTVAGSETQMGLLTHRENNDGFFTLLMQPPLDPSDNQVTPREITFILDVSGSMQGIPIEMSKEIVRRTLDRLRSEDIFNIFIFASGNGQLWNSPQPGTASNIAAAKNFLQSLHGSGGTEMLAGLQRALSAAHDPKYLQMYTFLTDGYVGNEDQILSVVKDQRGDARFFAFGIGSSVNRYLIDGIGKYGEGTSQVVLPRDREFALRATDQFFESIDSPVFVDIEIDWNGLPVREVYPKKIKDLFAGQTIAIIGRFQRPVSGNAYVKARVGSRNVRYEVKMNLPKKQSAHSALAPIWARHKIEELSGAMLSSRNDVKADLAQQITDLGVKHRLVTQYTSFVAVDESRITGNGNPLRVLQPVELPEHVSYEGNFGEHPVGETMNVSSWGLYVTMTQSGKIMVCYVDPRGVAARSGVRPGLILKSINRFQVHDMVHLNGLLLQTGTNVPLEFESGETIMMPAP